MKRIFTLIVIMALTIYSFAQAPQKMSYQAVIRNSSGQLVVNQIVGMQISILQGSSTGIPVYVETQTPNTNANGLVTVEIGGGTIVTGTFEGIDWSTDTYFIKTETDPTGGTSYTITGTSQILSVPYALYTNLAKTADYNDLTNKPVLFDGTWASITLKPTTLAGFGITDAATKVYTDALITNLNTALDRRIKFLEEFINKGIMFNPSLVYGTVTDFDGNVYKTIQIGTQTWMAENLKTKSLMKGEVIPNVTAIIDWNALSTPAYCWYNNDEGTNKSTYGALYNWYTINTNKLCPYGWHVPSAAEWTTLINYCGGESVAGGKLKEIFFSHWTSPNTGATNETGFTALPGGYRGTAKIDFANIGNIGSWWTTTPQLTYAIFRRIDFNNSSISSDFGDQGYGRSVRCIKN